MTLKIIAIQIKTLILLPAKNWLPTHKPTKVLLKIINPPTTKNSNQIKMMINLIKIIFKFLSFPRLLHVKWLAEMQQMADL